jgi:hypothetical protein
MLILNREISGRSATKSQAIHGQIVLNCEDMNHNTDLSILNPSNGKTQGKKLCIKIIRVHNETNVLK